MTAPLYIDVSHHNAEIDWTTYKKWSSQWDGKSRVCIKVSEGTDFVDPADHYAKALAAGIDIIIPYHYGRPDLHPDYAGAEAEVRFFLKVLGNRLRPQDIAMLDFEGFPGVPNAQFPGSWAWQWAHNCAGDAHISTNRVAIYSDDAFMRQQMQDTRLPTFPLIYARYNAQKIETPVPTPPAPYTRADMLAWQYSDAASVPGVPGLVDANIWLAPIAPPPPPPVDKAAISAALDVVEAQVAIIRKAIA